MPILVDTNTCKKIMRYWYVHIEFLPWDACQNDVRNFLSEFDVISGGISIHGSNAFVAFEDRDTAEEVVLKSDDMFHGYPVHLSVVDIDGMQDILLRNTRRTLKFDHKTMCKGNYSILSFIVAQRKKIRPTRINCTRSAISCSSFSPKEVEFPVVQCRKTERSLSCGTKYMKRSVCGIKKIHPTSVVHQDNWDTLPVFHPEKCYEMKQILV